MKRVLATHRPRPERRQQRDADYVPKPKRNYGRMRNCGGCRFWSEMNGRIVENGPWQGQCLNRASRDAYRFWKSEHFCNRWTEGEHGAIDDPANRGLY